MAALIGAQEPSALAAIASDIDSQAERFRCDQNLAIPIAKGFGLLSAVTRSKHTKRPNSLFRQSTALRPRASTAAAPLAPTITCRFPACAAKAPPLTGASTKPSQTVRHNSFGSSPEQR
jgi:hypothetical protein